MQSVIIGPNQAGQRFDKFLHKYMPEAPNSFLYKMLRKKNITLNGKKAEGKEMLKEGDEVKMFFAEETLAKFTGSTQSAYSENTGVRSCQTSPLQKLINQYKKAYDTIKGITVIYEDSHTLILNKPSGILTQKASDQDLSLNEWLIGYLLQNGSITQKELQSFKPSVCNRLDRNTSGLVICGKSLAGSQALSRLIHDREIRKFYRTITCGLLKDSELIEGYLVKNEKTNTVKVYPVSGKKPDTKETLIKTAYHPLAQFSSCNGNRNIPGGLTYLEVELITGKTHQIRAHLASTGHPLIGDYKYGQKNSNGFFREQFHLSSQLLHAYRLEFPEMAGVLSGLSNQVIIAPLPACFTEILGGCS